MKNKNIPSISNVELENITDIDKKIIKLEALIIDSQTTDADIEMVWLEMNPDEGLDAIEKFVTSSLFENLGSENSKGEKITRKVVGFNEDTGEIESLNSGRGDEMFQEVLSRIKNHGSLRVFTKNLIESKEGYLIGLNGIDTNKPSRKILGLTSAISLTIGAALTAGYFLSGNVKNEDNLKLPDLNNSKKVEKKDVSISTSNKEKIKQLVAKIDQNTSKKNELAKPVNNLDKVLEEINKNRDDSRKIIKENLEKVSDNDLDKNISKKDIKVVSVNIDNKFPDYFDKNNNKDNEDNKGINEDFEKISLTDLTNLYEKIKNNKDLNIVISDEEYNKILSKLKIGIDNLIKGGDLSSNVKNVRMMFPSNSLEESLVLQRKFQGKINSNRDGFRVGLGFKRIKESSVWFYKNKLLPKLKKIKLVKNIKKIKK